ncbi:terminase large subunit [Methylobacterium nodulans]|uniref:Terminase n=1 Tax=Methylobacterium nodulans (strain LMG 21967 / CNCM I-2342 / ORS 2060) TaxID=460265 RepID=B8IIN7_METNO|nr:terminase large subunit [Methylobacterium nodulans]ACL59914.1 Terminase [Methylobacterium nodulans ORS 2060]
MREWSTACPDWEERILAGRSLLPCGPLFPAEAAAAMEVFRALRIVDALGSPTLGEVCRPWVTEFAEVIFGAYDHASGRRLIREFFLCIAKKNGKSTLAAGLMLTALIRNWRRSAEFLILAPTIEVANNAFQPARDMVKADDELRALLHVQDHYRTITHRHTGAALKVVAADTESVSGKKATSVLVDELWLFGKRPQAENMLREATGGLVSRPEGFVIYVSTHADEPPAGVFKQKLAYFRAVRDGRITDPRSLGVLYEHPRAMVERGEHLAPASFRLTNPNLGLSVDPEWLSEKLEEARNAGPASLAGFAAKHLNVEIGLGLRADRWPGAEFWARRADPALASPVEDPRAGLQALLERCEVVVVGIDGGGLDDLFGLCVLGRERASRDWLAWSHGWCHAGVLERRPAIASRLRDFQAAGELTIVGDELADISAIVGLVAAVKERGLLGGVGVDPAGLGELIEAFAEIGVTQEAGLLVGVPQGYGLMTGIKTAERKLANGTLRHAGSALAAWCVANLKIEPTATAIRATKQNAGDAKIDLAMALFNAVVLMARTPEAHREPEYAMYFA